MRARIAFFFSTTAPLPLWVLVAVALGYTAWSMLP